MKNKWIAYVNMIGMGLSFYGGLMLILTAFNIQNVTMVMSYTVTTLLGIACLVVSFYKQCAILGAIDAKKLPHAYIFWAMMIVCMYFVMGNFVSALNDPSALYRALAGAAMLVVAGLIFTKKVVPINLKAARIENVLKRETVYTNKEKRRYTLMITNVIHEEHLLVEGIVHGEIKNGDLAALLLSDGTSKRVRVAAMQKGGITVLEAKDEPVQLTLDGLKNVNPDYLRFAVISSVLPTDNKPAVNVENPLLYGMTYEYARYSREHEFMTRFIRVLTHSRFTVPVMMEHMPSVIDGKVGFSQDTKIGFMGVNRTDSGKEVRTFALFTDMEALKGWKQLFRSGKQPSTLGITFQDAVNIMWKGHQGLVINPFGPVFVYLPSELIDVITKQDTYRKEFGNPGEGGMSFDRQNHQN